LGFIRRELRPASYLQIPYGKAGAKIHYSGIENSVAAVKPGAHLIN
jgi:hypothetical protein